MSSNEPVKNGCEVIYEMFHILNLTLKVQSCMKMEDGFAEQAESDLTRLVNKKNGDRMIKQLLNLVIAKYRDLSLSRRSVICNYLYLICSPLTNHDIFAQLRSIIDNYYN